MTEVESVVQSAEMDSKTSMIARLIQKIPLASFGYLTICQFIGAMNDNIYKLLLIFCFIQLEGVEASNRILSLAGGCYVIPFILFSATAGIIADRYSKRSIIVITRLAEIGVICLGIFAFWMESKVLAFSALILLGCHSAFFGPCKMGIIPEIVPKDEISKANGITTSFTYVAIIVGTFLASFLADITDRNFVLAASVALCFSFLSLCSSFQIKRTPPSGSTRKISPWFISEVLRTIKIAGKEPSLLSAVFGSSFFLFIGAFIQLNIIPFAMKNLHLTDVQGGYLFLLTALGIGMGSLLAGKVSGKTVEFGLVPIGGIGITICCFLLDHYSDSLVHEMVLLAVIGVFGGLYLVPLDSYIQVASPATYRGQVVSVTNFFGFCGVLFAAGALYVISEVLELPPGKGFVFVGTLTFAVVIAISISMSGYIVRFFSFLFSYLFFPASLRGKEQIPLDTPSIFFVPQLFWPWAPVLIAAQRKRMRLITVGMHDHPPYFARLARRMIPVLEVDSLDQLLPGGEHEDLFAHATRRGTSVAIFCSNKTLVEQVPDFIQAWKRVADFKPTAYFELNVSDSLPNAQMLGSKSIFADIARIG